MYKFIIFLLSSLLILSCNEAGTTDLGSTSEGGVTIESLEGNGSDSDIFIDGMTVLGSGFDETVEAFLDDEYVETLYLNASEIEVVFPSDIVEGKYALSVETDSGKATTSVYVLQGEQGEVGESGVDGVDGVDGADGEDGVTIESQYYCDSSSDIDDRLGIEMLGLEAQIILFNDGSYYIYCLSYFEYTTYEFWDYTGNSGWYASDSVAVMENGILHCNSPYANAYYSIDNNTVTYENESDETQYETVSCSQRYP
ncbi:MAG: hypothetical protein ABIA04_00395 [Pseudomonadota bacterium]